VGSYEPPSVPDATRIGDDDLLALRPDNSILSAREFYDQHLR
jgi:hypothetical protein